MKKASISTGKNVKRALAVALSLAIACLPLAACSSSGSSGATSGSATSSSATSAGTATSSSGSAGGTSSTASAEVPSTTKTTFVDTLAKLGSFQESTVEGSGDDVVDIPCAGAPCIMVINYSGSGNFAVWTVDSSGNQVDLLVNEIGSYGGTVTDYAKFQNASMVQVESEGSWSITFRPMSSMTHATNGYASEGDDVVYIDEPSLTKVHFTNTGSSNFVVWAYGMTDSDLLVNEIGSYDGTVIWGQPQSFFVVTSDGDWNISW